MVGWYDSSYYCSYSTSHSLVQTRNPHPSSLRVLKMFSVGEHLLNKEENTPRVWASWRGLPATAAMRFVVVVLVG